MAIVAGELAKAGVKSSHLAEALVGASETLAMRKLAKELTAILVRRALVTPDRARETEDALTVRGGVVLYFERLCSLYAEASARALSRG